MELPPDLWPALDAWVDVFGHGVVPMDARSVDGRFPLGAALARTRILWRQGVLPGPATDALRLRGVRPDDRAAALFPESLLVPDANVRACAYLVLHNPEQPRIEASVRRALCRSDSREVSRAMIDAMFPTWREQSFMPRPGPSETTEARRVADTAAQGARQGDLFAEYVFNISPRAKARGVQHAAVAAVERFEGALDRRADRFATVVGSAPTVTAPPLFGSGVSHERLQVVLARESAVRALPSRDRLEDLFLRRPRGRPAREARDRRALVEARLRAVLGDAAHAAPDAIDVAFLTDALLNRELQRGEVIALAQAGVHLLPPSLEASLLAPAPRRVSPAPAPEIRVDAAKAARPRRRVSLA